MKSWRQKLESDCQTSYSFSFFFAMTGISIFGFILTNCLLTTAMSFNGNRRLSHANQAGKANPFQDGLRPESRGASRLEPVCTIDSQGQTRYSMSWSSDDRYLATSTGKNVSVWRLPGKNLHHAWHANKNIDARSTMSEDEELAKVGRNVKGPL